MSRAYGRADIDFESWYSPWMKQLARTKTRAELEAELGVTTREAGSASAAHERAIRATTSMSGQSQRRAHARNVTAAAGDRAIALGGALEIHELFPEHAMGGRP